MKLLFEKKWYILIMLFVLIMGVLATYLFLQNDSNNKSESHYAFQNLSSETENLPREDENEEMEEIVNKVDVKGAVKVPGLYVANADDRVLDLIEKAGGLTQDADANGVNFALRVEDQMVIYVPKIGEEEMPNKNDGVSQTLGGQTSSGKVNINRADETELQTLTGIGPSKAEAIIQYRTENGPFKTIEDLKNISGIGEKTFEKLKDDITI